MARQFLVDVTREREERMGVGINHQGGGGSGGGMPPFSDDGTGGGGGMMEGGGGGMEPQTPMEKYK